MSFQFAHIQGYARSVAQKKAKSNKGGKTLNIQEVIDEATREPTACLHVQNPLEPTYLIGSRESIRNLPKLIDERIAKADEELRKHKKDKTRKDAQVLLTAVVSFPTFDDPDGLQKWIMSNLEHFKEKWGNKLQGAVLHMDEEYPHLHLYAIGDDIETVNVKTFHDGYVAEAATGSDHPKIRKEAYKAGMVGFQDEYFQKVGLDCGLLRIGPGRDRLTRKEHLKLQTNVKAIAQMREKAKALEHDASVKNDEVTRQLQDIPKVVDERVQQRNRELEDNFATKDKWWNDKNEHVRQELKKQGMALVARNSEISKEVSTKAMDLAKPLAKKMANKLVVEYFETPVEPIPDAPDGFFSHKKWLEVYEKMKTTIKEQAKKLTKAEDAIGLARETYELRAREAMKVHTQVKELTSEVARLLDESKAEIFFNNLCEHWMPTQMQAMREHYELVRRENQGEKLKPEEVKATMLKLAVFDKGLASATAKLHDIDIDKELKIEAAKVKAQAAEVVQVKGEELTR